jgi:Fic family protein
MVYHEIRKKKGIIQNYLVSNNRDNGKWIKKSKFVGKGIIPKNKLFLLKENFESEIVYNKSSENLSKEQIIEIEELKKNYLEKIGKLSKEEFDLFENTLFTELTYNSNAIEGSSLSLEDTNLILNEGILPEGKTIREINEARNHLEALNFIESYNGDLNEDFILKVHSIVLKNISERFAGRYRETSVRIFQSDVTFPSYQKIPQLIKNLIYWYKTNKTKIHAFELAILVSMKLVTIHPFIDGNGRVSRLVMNFLLKKKDYPMINIYTNQRAKYLKAVREANEEKYKTILSFCIDSLKENFKRFNIIN